MSSYFVNPLFSKYKGAGESPLEPTYYDCRFPQSVGRSHAVLYGPGAAAAAPSFQHPSHHVQEFFHPGPASGLSGSAGYQQNAPCALACHGDKFYGYEALPRQALYAGAQQDAPAGPYAECKPHVPLDEAAR
ncbi:hypothetical protein HGM15179_022211 [Zosterops borbonicus]|uniref:Uncharacterized protein n=1 Tax=Zosterops borbonicus TaxID=364589 RepID=A0A8K1FXK9_9PASS|nr:hypothetical protein HGM15179_022211 [Zosterops borbonicus]